MLEALHPGPTLDEQVYERLRRAIVQSQLGPGERVNVTDVAAQLGVSRFPVMHACQRLVGEGFLISSRRRGLTVAPLSEARVLEGFAVLNALECMAAAALAGAGKPAALRALQRLNDAFARRQDDSETEAAVEANYRFHRALWDGADLPYVRDLLLLVWDHLEPARKLAKQPWRRQDSVQEHQRILDAIQAGDPPAAEEAVRCHRQRTVERVRAAIPQGALS